ncbi:MAG TPA: hypothetical protein PLA94_06945 [Myxococcota bacterium]|nr:hypothetical protein [Myxococcota bacterium]
MFAWIGMAAAACLLNEAREPERRVLTLEVRGAPEPCRFLDLASTEPMALRAWITTGDRHRLPNEQLRAQPGGGWQVWAPELMDGDILEVEVSFPQGVSSREPELRVGIGLPLPPPPTAISEHHSVLTMVPDPQHPGWGFADPTRGYTQVEERWVLLPGTAPELLPLPLDAKVLELQGATALRGALLSQGDEVRVLYTLGGQQAQADFFLGPGSLVLKGPVSWKISTPATVKQGDSGIEITTETGARVAWRVERAGEAAVIPDLSTFLAGLTERFRLVSLPEPAEPMWLRPEDDTQFLWETLYGMVRDIPELPSVDPLRPGNLNRAWKRRAASKVQKGLILQRLLSQERIGSLWGLTGADVNMDTFTGFDSTILQTNLGWLDPTCGACAPGELSSVLMGQPLLTADGALETVPRLPGRMQVEITLEGDTFDVDFRAEAQAALWLREPLVGADPAAVPGRLLRRLDMEGATILLMEGVEKRGQPIHLKLRSPRVPALHWRENPPWTEKEAATGDAPVGYEAPQ